MNNFKNFKLIWDRLLIKPDPIEEKTSGGLFIPDQAKKKPQTALVMASGTGRTNEQTGIKNPMQCKVGDKVLYCQEEGYPVELDGEKYLMINDCEIWAVIEPAKTTFADISKAIMPKIIKESVEIVLEDMKKQRILAAMK